METVGRYRIVRQLGEGGMGVVYEAHDDRLDPRFLELLRVAETRHRAAAQLFVEHGGDRLLGVRPGV